ncbi:MAG: Flp pilus assembly protein CpaB [Burkholderiaceae bacterium]
MSTPLKLALLFLGAALVALAVRSLYVSHVRKAPTPENTVQIRVAADDLPAGLLLRNEDLDWKTVNRLDAPSGAIVQGNAPTDVTGVMIRRAMRAGTPILERDVIRPDAPGFLSAVLKPGMRAVSVSVDNVSGNAGLIQPGDYVDMILVQGGSSSSGSGPFAGLSLPSKAQAVVSETIVQKARVIAVGSVFRQAIDSQGNREDGRASTARTITVEVRPRAAEAVAIAQRLGTVTLALRSFAITDRNADRDQETGNVVGWQEQSGNDTGPLWAGDISRAISDAEKAAQAQAAAKAAADNDAPAPPAPLSMTQQPREITVFRGSQQATQPLNSAGQAISSPSASGPIGAPAGVGGLSF